MAARKAVTPEEVKEFFRLYEKYGNYVRVAEETGRSPSTIGRYIRKGKIPSALKQAIDQTIIK